MPTNHLTCTFDVALVYVVTMQAASVLLQRSCPRDRQRQDQSVQRRMIKTLANKAREEGLPGAAARREHLLPHHHQRQLSSYLLKATHPSLDLTDYD